MRALFLFYKNSNNSTVQGTCRWHQGTQIRPKKFPQIFFLLFVMCKRTPSNFSTTIRKILHIYKTCLTLLHSERPKLYTILAFLSANTILVFLSEAKIVYNFGLSECKYKFGLSECNRVNARRRLVLLES